MRDQRNARVLAVAELSYHITAQKVTDAIRQLQAERIKAIADGPDIGESAGRSSNETSTTERNATEGYRIGCLIEDLRDAICGLEIAHRYLLTVAEEGVRTRAFGAPGPEPVAEKTCRDNQHGKAGAILWGDPLCMKLPVKGGMCAAHYQAWYRHRVRTGRDVSRDFEEAMT
jgi:hypothetical protein